jgi:hypothetical protein
VLQVILEHEPVACSTITRLAGLSPPVVSRLGADLTEVGALREVPNAVRPKGPVAAHAGGFQHRKAPPAGCTSPCGTRRSHWSTCGGQMITSERLDHSGPARSMAAATDLPIYVDGHSGAVARTEQMFGDRRTRSSVVHLFVATSSTLRSRPAGGAPRTAVGGRQRAT